MPDRISIELDHDLFERVRSLAESSGCASAEAFILQVLERRVAEEREPGGPRARNDPGGDRDR